MWSAIWHTVFFDPTYNLLIFVAGHIPGGDVGIAIIVFTIVMKLILLPLSLKAAHTQYAMRLLEPKLAEIKEKYKEKREELARATMAAYSEAGINPLTSILLLFIQIPILIALFFAVSTGGGVKLPEVNTDLLYSFVFGPKDLSMLFFGVFDITQKSIILALLAAGTQYIQGHLSLPPLKEKTTTEPNLKEDLARSMQLQMKYMMPVVIGIAAFTTSSAIALYFVVSNIAAIAQEYIVRARIPNRHQ